MSLQSPQKKVFSKQIKIEAAFQQFLLSVKKIQKTLRPVLIKRLPLEMAKGWRNKKDIKKITGYAWVYFTTHCNRTKPTVWLASLTKKITYIVSRR